jgi:WD40 repeat protein
VCPPSLPAAFAWSPTADNLVAAWGGWLPELHVFDLRGKVFLGGFGDFQSFPSCMTWSDTGNYFAAASRGRGKAGLRLWPVSHQSPAAMPFAADPVAEFAAPGANEDWIEAEAIDTESSDEGAFSGFGRTAISPDESTVASVVEIQGEWADDLIVLLDVPKLGRRQLIPAQGHITDIAWTPDSRKLIYCSAGQAYRLSDAQPGEPEALPFGAELCACHPQLPLCLCFSSWLKNSAKGRLFLVDLNGLRVFDEYAAEGVVDIRWSLDGSKAYAVTANGLAYIYDPPLM